MLSLFHLIPPQSLFSSSHRSGNSVHPNGETDGMALSDDMRYAEPRPFRFASIVSQTTGWIVTNFSTHRFFVVSMIAVLAGGFRLFGSIDKCTESMYDNIMRCALYARVSTSDQNCEMQLRELREYISRRDWKCGGEYIDTGFSGAKASRPALDRLMADAAKRKFDCVAVWKIDRFGR